MSIADIRLQTADLVENTNLLKVGCFVVCLILLVAPAVTAQSAPSSFTTHFTVEEFRMWPVNGTFDEW